MLHRQQELTALADKHEILLLEGQYRTYEPVLKAIASVAKGEDVSHKCFFVAGKAGQGKTFTVNVLVNRFRERGDIVIISGSTVISVTLYERGGTDHSTFAIPVIDVGIVV